MQRPDTTDYEAMLKFWKWQREQHAERYPEHTTKRDVTMGGHEWCRSCHRYITY